MPTPIVDIEAVKTASQALSVVQNTGTNGLPSMQSPDASMVNYFKKVLTDKFSVGNPTELLATVKNPSDLTGWLKSQLSLLKSFLSVDFASKAATLSTQGLRQLLQAQ